MLEFVKNCFDPESGGIRASIGHDVHLLYTLSGVQIVAIHDALDEKIIDREKVVEYVKSLQQPDGSFHGDVWGEVDIRFSMCAICTLSILGRIDAIDTEAAVDWIMKCSNEIDGGFGSRPGSESHSGLIYCALGSLSLLGRLDLVDADSLGWWLSERQCPSGGMNGRPEKLPDLCYSWWVLASLHILGRLHWINGPKLLQFILASQDSDTGGFSDRPGNMVDPFHTCFGLTGLSLLAHSVLRTEKIEISTRKEIEPKEIEPKEMSTVKDSKPEESEPINVSKIRRGDGKNLIEGKKLVELIKEVNPVLCMPQQTIDRLNIKLQTL